MALKNIMRVDNGNVIYTGGSDGTEAKNFINNNLITSVNGTDVEFKFIYDSTQDKFGYRDASGTFVPFESGGDFSQLIYENLAAANIKSGTTISVKDPDGNVLNSATGSYQVNTFTNLTAANIKNGTTVTIKDSAGTTLKSVAGTCAILPTNSVVLVNTQNTVGGSYTTTRAYSFIVCAGSGSNRDNYTGLYPSFSCNGGSSMFDAVRNGEYDSSITCGRLTVFKNVPSRSRITYTPGSNNSDTYIIYGIY